MLLATISKPAELLESTKLNIISHFTNAMCFFQQKNKHPPVLEVITFIMRNKERTIFKSRSLWSDASGELADRISYLMLWPIFALSVAGGSGFEVASAAKLGFFQLGGRNSRQLGGTVLLPLDAIMTFMLAHHVLLTCTKLFNFLRTTLLVWWLIMRMQWHSMG